MTTPNHHYDSPVAEREHFDPHNAVIMHGDVHSHDDGHGHLHGHAVGEFAHPASISMLLTVFVLLLALTGLTVYQSTWDLGDSEIYLSLFIATIKAGLVILFFMHMLWDKLINVIVFFSSLIFATLFVGATLSDATHYKDYIIDADTLLESIPKTEAAAEGEAAH